MAASERAVHLIGAADEGAGAARQRTDEEAARAAGGEEGMEVTPSTAAAAAAGLERPARKRYRKKTAAPAALTAEEARAAAAAEGLELVPSLKRAGGFKGVRMQHDKYYMARGEIKGERHFLGSFATAEEAALVYQRWKKEARKEVEAEAALSYQWKQRRRH
jgi:hypothetical protein